MITLLQKNYKMTMTEYEARQLCDELGELLGASAMPTTRMPRVLEVYKLLDEQLRAKQGHSESHSGEQT